MGKDTKEEETKLISGCISKIGKDQERLYKKYYGYVMAIGMAYCTNKDIAREVVDDTFIKIFDSIESFDHKQSFKGWIRKITINCAIDEFRRNKKHLYHLDVSDCSRDLPAVELLDNLDIDDIYQLLGELPEMLRTVFNLYEIEGYDHKEISELMGIGESSSRTYLARAKERLRGLVTRHFK
ncbi:RNA polymerase sigma factor [Arenibacter algicola]|uniref:RNA polymerase sigma factor n=1 Tax=Arenibacter arenosicollis TaxID=2762274 RepID=A0ABR7QR43_9FLAO|nr:MULTISPECIES: RNA polymerase sigma factor [Arenibacter]MBC8769648.1 RNA polymerase sigma factor [Arenibacter arenosicollis]MBU2905889.1 RNA polymerase sigma factor [Arenibacter algicola]